uniref:Uncharacterized protein n=1 Tax=uncultured marine virus TaxID=186617 RepID=A0A0F7LB19_9VIRU|nr:hypothetical protein [uncultured marine virus]
MTTRRRSGRQTRLPLVALNPGNEFGGFRVNFLNVDVQTRTHDFRACLRFVVFLDDAADFRTVFAPVERVTPTRAFEVSIVRVNEQQRVGFREHGRQ